MTMTIDSNNDQTLDKIERARTVAILDCARKLSLSDDLAHQLITDGVELSAARMALIDARSAAERLHDELQALGVDILLDDRGERPGAMFAYWELIGVPQRIVISDRGLKESLVEVQGRRDAQASRVPVGDAARLVRELLGLA